MNSDKECLNQPRVICTTTPLPPLPYKLHILVWVQENPGVFEEGGYKQGNKSTQGEGVSKKVQRNPFQKH